MISPVKLMRWPVCLALVFAASASACHGSAETPSAPTPAVAATADIVRPFKVATWNIRSGMGLRGFTTTAWSQDTQNCTDRSQPLNAWGIGLPQAELERIRGDQAVVAMALQEAWRCGSPTNVNSVLGFKTASAERNGTALLARYGFSGAIKYLQFDTKANQWLVGGDVCLDPACSATIPIFAAHFGDTSDAEIPNQAQRVLDLLGAQATPRVLTGDLNVYQVDQWNPRVPCTGDDVAGRVRTRELIESAGYTDAWKATQSGEGWTGMANRNGCGSPNGNLFKRIDYVYSMGLRVMSTERFGRSAPGADSASDHVGVIAELTSAGASSRGQ
jgi:hypothetical protein